MTTLPSLPNRRRRRTVVAVALLLVVSLSTWWHWPRGDARFVGKWNCPMLDETHSVLTFYANGTVIIENTNYRLRHSWRVEKGKLIYGHRFQGGRLRDMVSWQATQVFLWTGTYYDDFRYSEHKISETTQNRIVLNERVYGALESKSVLNRIPECPLLDTTRTVTQVRRPLVNQLMSDDLASVIVAVLWRQAISYP